MKIKPVLTEKSMKVAEDGTYTFKVDTSSTKHKIKRLVESVFDVKVAKVRTVNKIGRTKKTLQGKKRIIKPIKKALVTLKGKDTIDIFKEGK